jgi:HK97 family phage prohead protease
MPYEIQKRNGKFCVVNQQTSAAVSGGCHSSRPDAERHMRALYANVPDAGGKSEMTIQNGIERKSFSIFDVKTVDDTGQIEAIVSVFHNVDHGNEIVRPGFFSKSIERKLPKGVWAHDWKQPIAKTLEARELLPGDPLLPPELKELGGTYIKGQFNLGTQRGKEAYSDIKFGIVDEFSIGYKVLKEGKDEKTGARELLEGDWKEWSPVLVGMNDQTRLLSIKEGGEPLPEPAVMTAEQLVELREAVGPDDLPLAPLDQVWGSTAAEKAIREFAKATDAPNADYAKSFFYVADDSGDKFGDYALPFALPVDGKLLAVPKRIIAVAERLDAMDISDEVKAAIRTKIDGYFAIMRNEFQDETLIAPWAKNDPPAEGETVESLSEKVKQLTAKIEAETEDKTGARNSASDKKKLQQIHDNAAAMESSVCASASKSIIVSDQVKGMYEDALTEMTTPTCWQVYYAYLEVLDRIEDLPATVGDETVDKPALVEEALQAMVTAMREASLAKLEEPEVEYVYFGAPPPSFKTLSSDLVTEPFDVHNLAVVTAVREIATRSSAIKMAIEALIDRANEKQEFRNADGRPVSALIRARKADIDKGLKDARENIAGAVEKSESLTLLEPEDLSTQMRTQMLVTQRLRLNAPVS